MRPAENNRDDFGLYVEADGQGRNDQIGRIFAHRAIVLFGMFFLKITEVARILEQHCTTEKSYV
jgi:hypothetical protein